MNLTEEMIEQLKADLSKAKSYNDLMSLLKQKSHLHKLFFRLPIYYHLLIPLFPFAIGMPSALTFSFFPYYLIHH